MRSTHEPPFEQGLEAQSCKWKDIEHTKYFDRHNHKMDDLPSKMQNLCLEKEKNNNFGLELIVSI